jgi:hypothetical protein
VVSRKALSQVVLVGPVEVELWDISGEACQPF